MKIAIVLNCISKKKKRFYADFLPALQVKHEVEVMETKSSHDAVDLAEEIVNVGSYDVLISAGGDGTLNQVLNGMLQNSHAKLPVLGLIPLGTGNDFSRSSNLYDLSPSRLLELLEKKSFQKTDIGKIECSSDRDGSPVTRYFINVSSLGISPEVVFKMIHDKRLWSPSITYFKTITSVFLRQRPKHISIKSGDWWWEGRARVSAIGNGRTFASDLIIGPSNKIDDGVFSIFIAGQLTTLEFIVQMIKLKMGHVGNGKKTVYHEASSFEIGGEFQMIEAEGEIQGWIPAKIQALPQHILFLR